MTQNYRNEKEPAPASFSSAGSVCQSCGTELTRLPQRECTWEEINSEDWELHLQAESEEKQNSLGAVTKEPADDQGELGLEDKMGLGCLGVLAAGIGTVFSFISNIYWGIGIAVGMPVYGLA